MRVSERAASGNQKAALHYLLQTNFMSTNRPCCCYQLLVPSRPTRKSELWKLATTQKCKLEKKKKKNIFTTRSTRLELLNNPKGVVISRKTIFTYVTVIWFIHLCVVFFTWKAAWLPEVKLVRYWILAWHSVGSVCQLHVSVWI